MADISHISRIAPMSILASMLIPCALLGGGLTDSIAPDPELRVAAFAGLGTGLSLAGGASNPLRSRSPTYIGAGASFTLSQLDWLTLDTGLLFEFEGRVGLGLWPRLRATVLDRAAFSVSAGVALPVFVHAYSLAGVSAFARGEFRFLEHKYPGLSVYVEPSISSFVMGNDLPQHQGLMKMDLSIGIHLPI